MNCPNCGAPMEPVGNRNQLRCPYCSTALTPDGEQDGLVPLGRDDRHACPVCAERLKAGTIAGKAVAYCPHCRGILTTSEDLAEIVAAGRAERPAVDAPAVPFDPAELRRVTACPGCGRRMDTHPYGGGGNAVIDSCLRCDLVWLDAGELTVLERYTPRRSSR